MMTKPSLWLRLYWWYECCADKDGQGCCCPHCCDYCRGNALMAQAEAKGEADDEG